jgi:hypothetical protein
MRTNLHKTAAIAAVLVSVATTAPIAFAQIAIQGTVNTNANVNAVNTSIKANVNANANANASTSRGSNSSADSHATTSLGQTVSGMVSGGQNKNAAVNIDAQISEMLHASDSNVEKVKTDDDSVTVEYKVPGHFLGIFPVRTTAYVTTDVSGKTKVHYPWYTFITSVNDASLRAQLESGNWSVTSSNKAQIAAAIQTALKAWVASNTSASTTTTTQ